MSNWPITLKDARAAEARLRPHLMPTALRRYAELDDAVGHGIRVLVKHENHLPTNAFKARNALAAMTVLSEEARRRGVVGATRGNHGQGMAWAGQLLGVPVTICVPHGNNPEKNAAMRGFGAELIETGRDYDESVETAKRLMAERGLTMIHSTNNADVIAGAATIALEMCQQCVQYGGLDALVVAVGGGSQAVGALVVLAELMPGVAVYGVQAERASVIHDSWHAGKRLAYSTADTFADGLATRSTYDMTFAALKTGLKGFVTVSEAEIANAIRVALRTTHNLVEGAGAAGLAGLIKLAGELNGTSGARPKNVAVIFSGSNIDEATLRKVLNREL